MVRPVEDKPDSASLQASDGAGREGAARSDHTVDVSQAFADLRGRLGTLQARLNPGGANLHFCPTLTDLAPRDFSDLLALAEDGLRRVLEHEAYFRRGRLYDDGMFWYGLFTLISTASLQAPKTPTVPDAVVRRLVEVLVDISRYSLAGGPSDIGKRNHEALGNLFCGFPSPALRTLARDRAHQSAEMARFVTFTVKVVEGVERRTRSTASPTT